MGKMREFSANLDSLSSPIEDLEMDEHRNTILHVLCDNERTEGVKIAVECFLKQ